MDDVDETVGVLEVDGEDPPFEVGEDPDLDDFPALEPDLPDVPGLFDDEDGVDMIYLLFDVTCVTTVTSSSFYKSNVSILPTNWVSQLRYVDSYLLSRN